MNRTLLSEMLAMATFIAAFWPMARRAGPHTRVWLVGWGCVMVQNISLMLAGGSPFRQHMTMLGVLWGAELSALCFLWGARDRLRRVIGRSAMLAVAVPSLLQAALYAFEVHALSLRLVAALLLLAPAVLMMRRPEDRTRPLLQLAVVFAALSILSNPFAAGGLRAPGIDLPFGAISPELLSQSIVGMLFLSAAYLFFAGAERLTRGAAMAGVGLIFWGLSYPASYLLARWTPAIQLDRALLDLPLYCVAYGMMLTLLEEHLGRTEQLALADHLTGLPNIRHFEDRFALANAGGREQPIACLVIDVDNFKQVNDTLGHAAGDELLKALAVRLAWHISPRDTLARTGGDEFTALLVGDSDEEHLHFIARAMMAAACVPVTIQGRPVGVKMSIGVAISASGRSGLAELRKAADDAMYMAKRGGGGRLMFAGGLEDEQMVSRVSGPVRVPVSIARFSNK